MQPHIGWFSQLARAAVVVLCALLGFVAIKFPPAGPAQTRSLQSEFTTETQRCIAEGEA
jgi:hypothetical protein